MPGGRGGGHRGRRWYGRSRGRSRRRCRGSGARRRRRRSHRGRGAAHHDGRHRLGFLNLENEDRIAQGNLVAVIEHLLFDPRLIYVGSIQAVEVADLELFSLANDHAMPPRKSRVIEMQLVARIAANGKGFLVERNALLAQRPRRA